MTDDNVISRGDAAPLMPEDVMGAKRGKHRSSEAMPAKGLAEPGAGLAGPAKSTTPRAMPAPSTITKKRSTNRGY
jgi:hypothetical protein